MPAAGEDREDQFVGEDLVADPSAPPPPVLEHPGTIRSRISGAATARQVPLATIVVTVLVVVAVAFVILLLWVLRIEVLYFVVATFVALLLFEPVRYLDRRGLPHGVSATLVFLVGVLAFIGILYLFAEPLVTGLTHFAKNVPTLVNQAEHGKGSIGRLVKRFHLQKWVSQNAPKLSGDITRSLKPAQALSVGAAALSTIIALATIAVLSFFILLEGPTVWRGFLGLLPPARAERVARVYQEASRSVTGYMLGNGLTSIIAGVIVYITLIVLGVPYPLLLGLWVALVDLLPLVGGLLAGVPTVIIALLHSPVAGIVTLIVFLVYQQVENHILNPVIMSKTVRLNPLWVLLAVLVGAKLGSQVSSGLGTFIGALIGIPVGGAIQVIVREIRHPSPATQPAPRNDGPVP